jgi:hypothetical protein
VRKEDLHYWHIWDEDGLVEGSSEREPRDGERYAILLQAEGEDVEQKEMPRHTKSRVQDFIKRTRWRRMKSRYKTEVGVEEPRAKKPPDEEHRLWSSVEESVQRKHTRYRQRFKQRKRGLLEDEELPSPLSIEPPSPEAWQLKGEIRWKGEFESESDSDSESEFEEEEEPENSSNEDGSSSRTNSGEMPIEGDRGCNRTDGNPEGRDDGDRESASETAEEIREGARTAGSHGSEELEAAAGTPSGEREDHLVGALGIQSSLEAIRPDQLRRDQILVAPSRDGPQVATREDAEVGACLNLTRLENQDADLTFLDERSRLGKNCESNSGPNREGTEGVGEVQRREELGTGAIGRCIFDGGRTNNCTFDARTGLDHGARAGDAQTQDRGNRIGRTLGPVPGARDAAMAEVISVKDFKPEFRVEKVIRGPLLEIKLRTDRMFTEESSKFEQGQSSG